MKYIIRQATIVDPNSEFNGTQQDILIVDGKVAKIETSITDSFDQEVSIDGMHISPGWVDMQANFRDPGNEYKEDITSGCKAAVKGGFTGVCIQSSTHPALDTKSAIEHVKRVSENQPVHVYPIGAITSAREGKELAELYDMHQSGAIAFSDDKRFIQNPKLLELALNYVKNFNGLIIHFADTPQLSTNGMMNEGENSVYLGMKGIPAIAEEMAITRDMFLLEYTQGKIHYNLLSTKGAVELIKKAKEKNQQVTSGVAAHQFYFTDDSLMEFDSIHKVNPPYREQTDVDSIIQALTDGTLDIICSDHSPEDIENKILEFEYAKNGIINIQTAFPVANTILRKSISIMQLIEKISINPRKILGLNPATIEEGAIAEFTLFNPNEGYVFNEKDNESKSKNSPFFNQQLTGKVYGIISKGKLALS